MKCPPALAQEAERLHALSEYGLGSDRPLPSLDPVVQIAARAFGMPAAAVNMIGSDHVFFAASSGIDADGEGVDLARDVSFCAHALAQDDVMVVPDASADDRFHDNPLVTGPARLRFYAGVRLLSPQGLPLGALCVIDNRPRHDFLEEDRTRLRELARMASDRLELRRVEIALERRARHPFEAFARNSPTAVAWFDGNGCIVDWNQAAATLYGYALAEGAGRSIESLVSSDDRPIVRRLVAEAVKAGTADGLVMPGRLSGLRKDGGTFVLGFSLFCWNDDGRLLFNVHLQDITARLNRRDALQRLANTDLLTGLANRASFYRQIEDTLLKRSAASALMIDLDGFKDVNDVLGHQVGDQVLCEIARRLEHRAGPANSVARIGGDEFAVLLPDVSSLEQASDLARALVHAVAVPILVDGREVRVAASCGVAVAPLHAREALELVGNADLALVKAKRIGRGQVVEFVTALRMEAVARRLYNIELHRAVDDGEFALFYQPQVCLADGRLVGAEALIRWRHPQRGLLSPAAFLPALEGGPLAVVVGAWVLDEACAQAAFWRRHGAPDFKVGINLSGAQFRVGDLVAEVTDALGRHGLPPHALELEVIETIVLDHDDLVLDAVSRLRGIGVGVAFDDFGTGYAALNVFKKYPLSRIKIDRSFVQSMNESDSDASVVRAILDMARSFGLETIAEGVETESQRRRLLEFGCLEGQGYLFGRPMPAHEFAETFGIDARATRAARA